MVELKLKLFMVEVLLYQSLLQTMSTTQALLLSSVETGILLFYPDLIPFYCVLQVFVQVQSIKVVQVFVTEIRLKKSILDFCVSLLKD